MHESALAAHWTIDPRALYLNHGSFGACPRVVLEKQSQLNGGDIGVGLYTLVGIVLPVDLGVTVLLEKGVFKEAVKG